MRRLHVFSVVACVILTTCLSVRALGSTLLLRFPDVHEDRVVFCYAGDLWIASTSGDSSATRLTTHPGLELFPKFSPDGKTIAFSGQYDGDEQVYVMPVTGGSPERLTHFPAWGPLPPRWGYDNQVYGFTPDGSSVLFRSLRYGWNLTDSRLFTVPTRGGLPQPLPMPVSGGGDLSPDAKFAVYSPLFRDFRTWKRYQGGWAQDLYIFDLEKHTSRQLTKHARTERDPMWIGDRVFYASDKDGTLNIYSRDVSSDEEKQWTKSKKWDVRWPSADAAGRIVFEFGGALRVLDTRSGEEKALAIRVPTDSVTTRPKRISAANRLEDFEISPDGRRALFVARGDVFTVPVEHGVTRNLTKSSGVHDKWAMWSPDGKHIAYLSDQTGEEELWIVPQDGKGQATQLTFGGTMMRYAPKWSSDSKKIAFSDKVGRLFVLTVADRQVREVSDNPAGRLYHYRWSPCGSHIAFTLGDANSFSSIWIWSESTGKSQRVTEEIFNEFGPAWGPKGDYLYYFSDREYGPQIGSVEWNYLVDRETGIFALALRKDVAHPFPPRSDEVKIAAEEPKKVEAPKAEGEEKSEGKKAEGKKAEGKKAEGKKAEGKKPIVIDFDGLSQRVARVPVPSANYRGSSLYAVDGHLIYVRGGAYYYGRSSNKKSDLCVFSLEDRKERVAIAGTGPFVLSADRKSAIVRVGPAFKLCAVPKLDAASGKTVSTSNLYVDRVPAEEWAQIFDEVWRRFRDFFYVPNMHGYDWKALRDRYRPLLAHVGHRSDLNYLIGEMISELNVSHAYITGGDWEKPARAKVGLLGARFELDAGSGRYRIAKILRGQNEEATYRAPLTEIGVNVGEGDYLLAIDGEELLAKDNPYRALRHKGGQAIVLTVNSKPELEGAREVRISPIGSEGKLNYLAWVVKNRARVAEATKGRVGYIHIPDMGDDGIREFIKWYYGQIRKEGLVVDVRNNGGGNVSQMLIERLRRKMLGADFSRNSDYPDTYPSTVFHGSMVCILDGNSASDGDIFPHMFRRAGLGPLLGKRSWGGVIGITNRGTLIDGGSVNVPEFGFNDTDGSWIVEGHGVDPDIEVELDPKALIEGRDTQLERAIEEVLARMKADPKKLPKRPADPVRTK